MNFSGLLAAGTSMIGGGSGSGTAPSAAGPTTFGNVTQSGGNTGLSTVAVVGIAVTVLAVGGLLFFAMRRGK